MLSTKIRPYEPADLAECIGCFNSNIPRYFTVAELGDYREWLESIGSQTNTGVRSEAYYVVSNEDQLVGCGGFGLADNKHDIVFAWGLINKEHHKRGYGKALAMFRLDIIRHKFPTADVILDTTQHTYRFFEKLGFVIEKVTKDFYAPGLDRYDMRLKAMP